MKYFLSLILSLYALDLWANSYEDVYSKTPKNTSQNASLNQAQPSSKATNGDLKSPSSAEDQRLSTQDDYQDYQQKNYQQQQRPAYNPDYVTNYRRAYFKGALGLSKIKSDFSDPVEDFSFDSTLLTPLTLAYGIDREGFSLEGEYSFNFIDFDFFDANNPAESFRGDMITNSLMFNGSYKLNYQGLGPYFGGGLGITSVSVDGVEDEVTGSSFAIQAFVGLDMRVNDASFFIEGRVLRTLGLDIENDFVYIPDFDFQLVVANIGFRYYF